MPEWLRRQFSQAFYYKDKYRIRLLNDFWFSYIEKEKKKEKDSVG